MRLSIHVFPPLVEHESILTGNVFRKLHNLLLPVNIVPEARLES